MPPAGKREEGPGAGPWTVIYAIPGRPVALRSAKCGRSSSAASGKRVRNAPPEWLARCHGFRHLDHEKSTAQLSASSTTSAPDDWRCDHLRFAREPAGIAKARELHAAGSFVPWWF